MGSTILENSRIPVCHANDKTFTKTFGKRTRDLLQNQKTNKQRFSMDSYNKHTRVGRLAKTYIQ